MLPLLCHVKYLLNARETEILAHTADSCFETKYMMDATSGGVGVQTVEKYSFLFGMAGKDLQYLRPCKGLSPSPKRLYNDLPLEIALENQSQRLI